MPRINEYLGDTAERSARLGRPVVTLSYAQTLDGCLSARAGEGLAISCPETKLLTHQLRAAHDAILVGIGTVLSDDPRLTARLVGGPHPQPIILDRQLRVPLEAQLMRREDRKPWIVCASDAPMERQHVLVRLGVRLLPVPVNPSGQLDLPFTLKWLGRLGLRSLMVEGGAQVLTSFLAARLVDQVAITIAPFWAGGLGSIGLPLNRAGLFPALTDICYEPLGKDLVVWGQVGEEPYVSSGPVFHGGAAD